MTRTHCLFVAIIVLFSAMAVAVQRPGANFAISWHTIDGGGGISVAGDLQLTGTIAQPDTAVMSSCPADLNRDGVVNSIDLTLLLTCFDQPADACDHDCDVNGDGQCDMDDLDIMVNDEFGALCRVLAGGFWQFNPAANP